MDDNSFGARLAAARAAGYNQTEVAKYITEAGFPVRTQAVSKWERGTTLPSARQLCRALPSLSYPGCRRGVCATEERRAVRTLPLYRLAVSAGTGRAARRDGLRHRRGRRRGIAERGLRRAHCRRQHGAALLFTGRSSGVHRQETPAPARSACSSITARGTASGSSALRGAWSLCRSTRGMPPSVWRRGRAARIWACRRLTCNSGAARL